MFQVGKNECISQSFFQFLPLLRKDSLEFLASHRTLHFLTSSPQTLQEAHPQSQTNMAAKAVCVLKSEKVNGVVNFVQDGVNGIFSLKHNSLQKI